MSRPSDNVPDIRVPDDLGEIDQWVLWRYESRKGQSAKVPCETPDATGSASTVRGYRMLGDLGRAEDMSLSDIGSWACNH